MLDLLSAAPLIDGHNDLLWELRQGRDPADPTLMTDLPRMAAGGAGAQFWSVYVPSDLPADRAVAMTLEQIDALLDMVRRNPDRLEIARSADDVERIAAAGRVASMIGVEGGHAIGGSLGTLRVIAAALVVGPGHFINPIFEYLHTQFDDVVLKRRPESEEGPIDGYILLLKREESRLGWRIVCEYERPPGFDRILRDALAAGELHDLLSPEFRERHLHVVKLLKALGDGVHLSDQDIAVLEQATRLPLDSVLDRLGRRADEGPEIVAEPSTDGIKLSIVVTTLVGAKGLEAGHVFVAGVIDGHFPRQNDDPSETEVCEFLVALTRTRKRAHVISAGRYAADRVRDGVFIAWIDGLVDRVMVDKDYIAAAEGRN